MNYLKTILALAFCLALVLSPAAALSSTLATSQTEETVTTTRVVPREGGALDKFTGVAAVVSIVIVGAAGVYIYSLIRKGL